MTADVSAVATVEGFAIHQASLSFQNSGFSGWSFRASGDIEGDVVTGIRFGDVEMEDATAIGLLLQSSVQVSSNRSVGVQCIGWEVVNSTLNGWAFLSQGAGLAKEHLWGVSLEDFSVRGSGSRLQNFQLNSTANFESETSRAVGVRLDNIFIESIDKIENFQLSQSGELVGVEAVGILILGWQVEMTTLEYFSFFSDGDLTWERPCWCVCDGYGTTPKHCFGELDPQYSGQSEGRRNLWDVF